MNCRVNVNSIYSGSSSTGSHAAELVRVTVEGKPQHVVKKSGPSTRALAEHAVMRSGLSKFGDILSYEFDQVRRHDKMFLKFSVLMPSSTSCLGIGTRSWSCSQARCSLVLVHGG